MCRGERDFAPPFLAELLHTSAGEQGGKFWWANTSLAIGAGPREEYGALLLPQVFHPSCKAGLGTALLSLPLPPHFPSEIRKAAISAIADKYCHLSLPPLPHG